MALDEFDRAVPASSSVVIKGLDATTFSEMEAFVRDLESRPTERLLRDLPQLMELSSTKVSLVSYVLTSKYKTGTPEERARFQDEVAAAAESVPAGETRDRIAMVLQRLR